MTPKFKKILEAIGPKATVAYIIGSVSDNATRIIPSTFHGFNENILRGAARASHVVLFSGQDPDGGDQAYLKRQDGSILAIEGPIQAKKYETGPDNYETEDPLWYGWSSNFGGWDTIGDFLS